MSQEYRIRFLPIDRSVPAEEGDNLLETAMKAGVHINASCGGRGACGKCRVRITDGEVTSSQHPALSDADREAGFRLACSSFIKKEAVIEVPLESQVDRSILRKSAMINDANIEAVVAELMSENTFEPLVGRHFLSIPEPNLNDNISDAARLTRALVQTAGIPEPAVPLHILRQLGKTMREAKWKVTVCVASTGNSWEIVSVEGGDRTGRHYALAVDVGTTTIGIQLVDCTYQKGAKKEWACDTPLAPMVVAGSADYNGQISYGEDVISRIMFAGKKGGLKKLQDILLSNINGLIGELASKAAVDIGDITHVVVAGNTTMIHLLFGIDPKYIMLAPYTPVATVYRPIVARQVGLQLAGHAMLYAIPGVSSYVGGDIVSGVALSGMVKNEKVSLFIDIGTNGEIVLGNSQWLLCASCSAGPAFEGGGIEFGMRATPGAIEKVRINPVTLEPMILTVGRSKPLGICGSGLIDIVAELLLAGIIDRNGKFSQKRQTPRIRKGNSGHEYVIYFADDSKVERDIVITELDLDNIMRTKAAIYAGCKVLLNSGGLAFPDIDMVIIAGGFGHSIDVEKAVTIGLLPEMPVERFRFIGNASLGGALAASVSGYFFDRTETIAKSMTNIELSDNGQFMDEFMAAMFLPHTDGKAFPGVIETMTTDANSG